MLKEIDATVAFERIATGEVLVLDVREVDEFTYGRIPTAINNPLSEFDMTRVPRDIDVIVVCRSGARSARVCEALDSEYPRLFNLHGGMKAWSSLGFEMASDTDIPEVI